MTHNKTLIAPLFVTLALASQAALANVGAVYGFGSQAGATANTEVANVEGSFAAYTNPAFLSLSRVNKLQFAWSLVTMDPQFTPINNVIVENTYLSDKVRKDSVVDDYRSTIGQAFSIQFKPIESFFHLGLGLVAYLPIEQLAYMDTGEPFVPEYSLYRGRTHRPQIELGASVEPVQNFTIGAGLHLGYTLTSYAQVFLNTSADKPSWIRFSSSLKPKLAPYFGLGFQSSDKDPTFTAGAVVRLPLAASNQMLLKSGARVFGSFAAVDFNFNALSALFYDPLRVELGVTVQPLHFLKVRAEADFEAWTLFEASTLTIQDPTSACDNTDSSACGISISAGKTPKLPLVNTWTPKVGTEFAVTEDVTLRLGYAYVPSIFSALPTGAANFLDPPKHSLNAGLGYHFTNFLGIAESASIDAHFSYHLLKTQTIVKAAGDEAGGGSGDLKIGAPGYDAGGRVLGGGLSATLHL